MALLILPILVPVAAGVIMLACKGFENRKTRNIFTGICLFISAAVTIGTVFAADGTLTLFRLTENASFALRSDALTRFFSVLMSIMWTLVGFYAFDYMKHEEHERRFFGFYLIVMGVLSGIYMSANLITLYLFYEMMTLTSLPLVLHSLTPEAISAGTKYLFYSVGGAVLSLVAIF